MIKLVQSFLWVKYMNNASQMRILLLYKWLMEETDSEHPITSKTILERWEKLGVATDRRSVYKDIETLQDCGCDIVSVRGAYNCYYIEEKEFSLAELKILIDAIEACQTLPPADTKRLVDKLSLLAVPWEREELKRPVFLDKAYKNTSHMVLLTTDTLYEAIRQKKKISFNYLDYSVDKRKIYKHNRRQYTFSPYFLKWDRDKYYVVGYSDDHDNISHFRVDRLANVEILGEKAQKKPKGFNPSKYATQVFGMYSSELRTITLRCENDRMRDVVDKFGKSVPIKIVDKDHFDVMVEAEASPPFFGWVFQFGGRIKIISPEEVINHMEAMMDDYRNKMNKRI